MSVKAFRDQFVEFYKQLDKDKDVIDSKLEPDLRSVLSFAFPFMLRSMLSCEDLRLPTPQQVIEEKIKEEVVRSPPLSRSVLSFLFLFLLFAVGCLRPQR